MAKTFIDYLADFGSSELFGFDSSTGQIIPQTSSVKNAVKSLINDAFNQNLNIEDETPVGRICETLAVAIARFCSVTASYANQINPNYATGQMLDAIGSLFDVRRNGASGAVIGIVITGSGGTVIPEGAIIKDKIGNEFSINNTITIPSQGDISTTAICTKTGIISIEPNTVTSIVSTVPGWIAVTNTNIIKQGSEIETDEHYRSRILLARWTGSSFVESIIANIERVSGVDSAIVIENGSSNVMYCNSQRILSETIPEGKFITINPHSICAIVHGHSLTNDSRNKIASAIYETKSAGCGYTSLGIDDQGSNKGYVNSINIRDEQNNILYPVVFSEPSVVTFSCNISVNKNTYSGTDDELRSQIKSALQSWALGEAPFVDGLKIGQSIFAFEAGSAISVIIPSIQIRNVSIVIGGQEYQSYLLGLYEISSINLNDCIIEIL